MCVGILEIQCKHFGKHWTPCVKISNFLLKAQSSYVMRQNCMKLLSAHLISATLEQLTYINSTSKLEFELKNYHQEE